LLGLLRVHHGRAPNLPSDHLALSEAGWLNTAMRYRDIIDENSNLNRVMTASRKKNEAQRKYQEKLRSIRRTAPASQLADREAAARNQYQDQIRSADDALLRALIAK